MAKSRSFSVLPGFGLSLGYTLVYLGLIVLIPLAAVFIKTAELSWEQFWAVVSSPRVVASYQLSFGASLLAAVINAVFGMLLAWTLVRYSFPGKKIIDALRSEEHTSELQSRENLVCRLLLEKKKSTNSFKDHG